MNDRSHKSSFLKRLRSRFRRSSSSSPSFLSLPQRINRAVGITAALGFFRRFMRRFFSFEQPAWTVMAKRTVVPPTYSVNWKHLLNPMYWIVWSLKFFWTWFVTRPYLNLGPAIPAILVMCLLAGFVVSQKYGKRKDQRQTYEMFMAQALDRKDYDTAVVAASTLIDMNPDNHVYRYQRALIESKRENHDLAQDMMERLAIGNKYGMAALWLMAKGKQISDVANWQPVDHQRFRALIAVALSDLTRNELLEAQKLMVSYLVAIDAKSEAIQYLTTLCEKDSSFAFTTALLCHNLGRKEESQKYATLANRHFESILLKRPDDIDARLKQANALLLLDQEERAIVVLNDGLKLTQDGRLRSLISDAYTIWSVRLASTKKTQFLIQRFQLLTNALQVTPNHPPAVDAMVELLVECRDDQDEQLNALKQAALQGIDPDSVHFIKGTLALLDNKPDEAKMHFLVITKNKENRTAGILNNLAMAIAKSQGGDLKQARQIADMAIEQLPDHPYLRETRGQILFKLKDYRNAIIDLERAAAVPELQKDTFTSLAAIYRQINKPEIAAEYEEALKKLDAKPTP